MSKSKLLHLTLTSDPDGSAWRLADAKQRMERAMRAKLGEALREAKGPITLTLELYKEDA